MKKQIPLLLCVFLILLSGKLISQPVVTPGSLPLYQDGRLYFHLKPGSGVVVKNKDTITSDPGGSFHSLFTKYQVTKTERPFAGLSAGLDKTYRLGFNQPARVDSFILELSQISSDVEYAEKVSAMYTFLVPNDPVYTNSPTVLYHLPLLNANLASSIYTANGNAVVAIVDNAILTTHDDLLANIGSSVTTWTDVADADNDPNPPLSFGNASLSTHGTHVAGIAGAVTNNSIGIASIGWNNRLMCVKATPDAIPGTTITNGYDGLAWAALHGAHVVNLSWGGYSAIQTEYSVVVGAKSHDVVIVASAGNDATSSPLYPAAYGEGTTGQAWEAIDHRLVVSVAALDQNNDRAVWGIVAVFNGATFYSGSNYGSWVDIAAYGTNIYSTLAASTASGIAITNLYGQFNGTSMAAPMVSGIAGVMRSYDMSRTADQIIDCLLNTANPDIYGTGHPSNQAGTLGSGRADAYAALRCLTSACSFSPIAIISASSPSLCPGATVTLTANQGSGYLWSTGSTLQSVPISTTGVYNVTVSYAGGCSATASITIPNADLTAHVDILENSGLVAGDGIMCGPFPVNLYAHWGLSYNWHPYPGSSPALPGGGSGLVPINPFSLPSTYAVTVTISGVGGCPGVIDSASVLMQWIPLPTVTVVSATIPDCPGTAVTITASGANTYTWYASSIFTITPTTSTTVNPYITMPDPVITYTVAGTDNNGCIAYHPVNNIVLTSPYAQPWNQFYLSSTISGTYNSIYPFFSIYGSYIINSDISVSGVATFSVSDVLFGPGVKLTVPAGSTLNILGSHLHTCPDEMWQGIVVEDGGAVYMDEISGVSSNLIEDAVKAIDMSNHTTSTLTTILDISKTIFNRNFIGINVNNYQRSVATYSNPIHVSNCVFTCRDLPFTPTVWPTSATTSSVDLRFATSATTGVAPPYLAQADYSAAATLKNPYASIPSQYGILLTGVGTSTGGTYYGAIIGDDSSPANFNLFDSHSCGISAVSSNVKAVNNVFQNLAYNPASSQAGIGIKSSFSSGAPDGSLDLTASDPGVGNRFWNCFTGVSGNRLFNFGITNSIFRSTQSSTTATSTPGNCGINLSSSRFLYQMIGNEFTNINTGINVPLVAAPSCTACPGGIYAANLTIQQNTFSTGGGSTAYVNQAISVSVPNAVPVTLPASLVSPAIAKAVIELNVLSDVYRGIYINGFNGFPTSVSNNTISLADDDVFFLPQHGIDLSNTMSAYQSIMGNGAGGQTQEVGNQVSGTGTVNAQAALFYNSMNVGFASPSVTCNDARNSYQGFVFYGQNALTTTSIQGTHWLTNNMQDLAYGMYLSTSGVIGQQCNASFGMGNTWSIGSSAWSGNHFAIYTYSSYAVQSPLYYVNSGSSVPSNEWGNPTQYSYANLTPNTTSVAAQASCSFPMQKTTPATLTPNYDSEDIKYIFNTGQFRFLRYNDSIKMANKTFRDFYTNMLTTYPNAENLAEADEYLAIGDYTSARTELSAMTPTNTIEDNYKSFYTLYANYQNDLDDGVPYGSSDSTTLYELSLLCPGHNGTCVYQARALYSAIYNQVLTVTDFCDTLGGARLAHFQNAASASAVSNVWDVGLFPNPAANQLNFVSSQQSEELLVSIADLTGRVLLNQRLKTTGFIANLEINLVNGVYLITTTSSNDKKVIKKLVIAK